MQFVKMEGLGNDFILVVGSLQPSPDEVRTWADRRTGIGADGVVVATPLGGNVVRMKIFNTEGGEAELSGNGLRCVARMASDKGWVDGPSFSIETKAGSHRVEMRDGHVIAVELGAVTVGDSFDVDGHTVYRADIGNPHAVLLVDDPDRQPVAELGGRLERSNGVNVEFAGVIAADRMRMRVWERGVGETLACGTGAAAAQAVAHALDQVGADVVVELLGGLLLVELRGGVSWIAGPANYVFEGRWTRT